jgi:hypothetical protein
MKYCIRCAREIGEGHAFCPYCGTSQKIKPKEPVPEASNNSSSKTMVVVGVAIFVTLIVILTAVFESKSKSSGFSNKQSSYHAVKENSFAGSASVQVNASQILNEFKNNEIRAGEKYNGKRVRINGCATDIDNTFGILSVSLNSCGGLFDLDFVIAEFPQTQKSKLATLNKGQRIVVECTIVDGGNIMGVHGKNCSLR